MRYFKYIWIGVLSLVLLSCDKEPPITDAMLDGDLVFDPSLYQPEKYLVSARLPNPSAADLEKHVIIAAHGYTATTFEWQEFADWSKDSSYMVSQVLLDGHGRSYKDFKASTWQDWIKPIMQEYEKLLALGYTKISLVGSSTGGALLIELLSNSYFDNKIAPQNIFLVDAIVVPTIKIQSIAGLVGPMLVYVETDQTAVEDSFWYRFRPHETINELNKLIANVQQKLENGITASSGTQVHVFQSKYDPTSSATGAVLVYKGLKHKDGARIKVDIVDSDIHVFTRLSLRPDISEKYKENQLFAFRQISQKLR
jgi:carboxylesterase